MKTKHLKTGLTLLFSMALASQSVMAQRPIISDQIYSRSGTAGL